MPQVPFPHILTYPANNSFPPRGPVVRIVSPDPIEVFKFSTTVVQGNDYRSARFRVSEVIESRKAKGDWSNWDKHPNYYECKVEEILPA
jgi:hypothetical protein